MARGGAKVVVYGAGGHGKVILDILERDDSVQIEGLVDDDASKADGKFFGYPILGGGEALQRIVEQAQKYGFNAICNVRYETADVGGNSQTRRVATVAILASATAYYRATPSS